MQPKHCHLIAVLNPLSFVHTVVLYGSQEYVEDLAVNMDYRGLRQSDQFLFVIFQKLWCLHFFQFDASHESALLSSRECSNDRQVGSKTDFVSIFKMILVKVHQILQVLAVSRVALVFSIGLMGTAKSANLSSIFMLKKDLEIQLLQIWFEIMCQYQFKVIKLLLSLSWTVDPFLSSNPKKLFDLAFIPMPQLQKDLQAITVAAIDSNQLVDLSIASVSIIIEVWDQTMPICPFLDLQKLQLATAEGFLAVQVTMEQQEAQPFEWLGKIADPVE